MVLESFASPFSAENSPKRIFFLGVVYYSVALFLSLWIFKQHASLISVFFTVTAAIPLMYNTLKYEEQKDIELGDETQILKQHSKALYFFMMLFFGITLAASVWYVVLPSGLAQSVFSVQTDTINQINTAVQGHAVGNYRTFTVVFFNNVKVLTFSMLFSFLYGAGAIFILTWNATVIGAAMGNVMRLGLADMAHKIGLEKVTGYFHVFSFAVLRYAVHGIPEILAYFVGALAGGIISVAVINHDFGTKRFEKIVLDTSDLLIISLLLLLVAAVLEVWVTPILY
ncbi:stage II sporulation protein M [Candidatus Woesearchaeota archaeon]|nr:stage II sporulation protein M [Candidatus Woesearchaeota archaeon]